MSNITVDYFPNVRGWTFLLEASTILFVLIWSYFSSFYLYFFPLPYSLSLALATVISRTIPDQNLIPYPENPILLCYPLTICIANYKMLHLGRASPAPAWSVGRMAQEQSCFISTTFTGPLGTLESISSGDCGGSMSEWAGTVAEITR